MRQNRLYTNARDTQTCNVCVRANEMTHKRLKCFIKFRSFIWDSWCVYGNVPFHSFTRYNWATAGDTLSMILDTLTASAFFVIERVGIRRM